MPAAVDDRMPAAVDDRMPAAVDDRMPAAVDDRVAVYGLGMDAQSVEGIPIRRGDQLMSFLVMRLMASRQASRPKTTSAP